MLTNAIHLTCWLVLLSLVFVPVEHLFGRRERTGGRRSRLADIGYYYLNGLLPALLLSVPLALLAAAMRTVTPAAYSAAIAALPLWATLPAGLLVAELGSYVAHRWCHRSPYLWQFHAVHHTPDHLDWLVNTRAHPIDIVVTRLGGLAPLYLFGLNDAGAHEGLVPALVTVLGTFLSFLVHANVRWRLGWLEQLIATPAFHHWHHTNDEHRDRNFAATLPIIDRLFGTLHLPGHWPPVYGIDRPVAPTLRDELLLPFAPRRADERAPAPCPDQS
jgi:sterol desaturase/sphingolipid hydroxylase (fatty acid hydroxylase superfamily)